MEINKIEVNIIEAVVAGASNNNVAVLEDLQLALVGGGNAAVDFG